MAARGTTTSSSRPKAERRSIQTWFGNLKANPEVEVEVAGAHGTEKFKARARVADSRQERDRLYGEMTRIWPAFADYQTRTDRLIPVVILERLG